MIKCHRQTSLSLTNQVFDLGYIRYIAPAVQTEPIFWKCTRTEPTPEK